MNDGVTSLTCLPTDGPHGPQVKASEARMDVPTINHL
jgi:hypothetical protein